MINSAMLRNQRNILGQLKHRTIRTTIESVLKTVAKEVTKGFFSPIYKVVEEIVKQVVIRRAADNTISSRLDTLMYCQELLRNIAVCLIKTFTFTAPITKLVKRDAELAIKAKTKFYDPTTIADKRPERDTTIAIDFSISDFFIHI